MTSNTEPELTWFNRGRVRGRIAAVGRGSHFPGALSLVPVLGGAFVIGFDYARDLDRSRLHQVATEAGEAFGDAAA